MLGRKAEVKRGEPSPALVKYRGLPSGVAYTKVAKR